MAVVRTLDSKLHQTGHNKGTPQAWKYAAKALKRIVPFTLAMLLIPTPLVIYLCCGVVDVLRNKRTDISTLSRYFTGNGILTWILSPFNLLMDVLTLPYWNKGIYELTDLPQPYQDEINSIIDAANKSRLVEELETRLGQKKRGMIFFKWYGRNLKTSFEIPEFHRQYRYIRTIGVSVFNTRQSTGEHFGPLRVTLRVLYNINTIDAADVYIKVGDHRHQWNMNKLFIFDDTLQHQSCNESNAVRYCMFVDILRPSLWPGLLSAVLSGIRLISARFNSVFYKNWTFIK